MKRFILSTIAVLALSMAVPQAASAGRIVKNGKTIAQWEDQDVADYVHLFYENLIQLKSPSGEDEWVGCDGWC